MSHPRIWKRSGYLIDRPNESTPVFYNGQVLVVSTPREGFEPVAVEVRDWHSGTLVSAKPWTGLFGTAIVVDGEIHVFGATAGGGFGNKIIHSVLDGAYTPSAPQDVWQSNPACDRAYNMSVSPDPTGFVMAVESGYSGLIFFHAPTINGPWTPYGNIAPVAGSCPVIKHQGDWYNVYYMKWDGQGQWRTYAMRSPNLLSSGWQYAYAPVLTPDGPGTERICASDFDFCEANGRVYGTYFDGDQQSNIGVKTCMFLGTEEELAALFFGNPALYH